MVFFVIMSTSCSKDDDTNDGKINGVYYIKSIEVIGTDLSGIDNWSEKHEFIYDSQHRISKYKEFFVEYHNQPRDILTEYIYSDKKVSTICDGEVSYYYLLDDDGKVIKIGNETELDEEIYVTYDKNGFIEWDDDLVYDNNNLIESDEATYTYTDKVNNTNIDLAIFLEYSEIYYDQMVLNFGKMSKNLLDRSYSIWSPGNGYRNHKYTYEYDKKGRIVKIISNEETDWGTGNGIQNRVAEYVISYY